MMAEPQLPPVSHVGYVRVGGSEDPGEPAAFEQALAVCERMGARLTVLTICEEPPAALASLISTCGISLEGLLNAVDIQRAHDELLKTGVGRGLVIDGELFHSSGASEVLAHVERRRFGLLIKAAESATTWQHWLHGHLDRRLMRECTCPVWIIKAAASARRPRILAAIDVDPFGTENSSDCWRLSTAILELSVWLSRATAGELHVVHVWDGFPAAALHGQVELKQDAIAAATRALRLEHETALARLVAGFRPAIARIHVVQGTAAEEISRLAIHDAFQAVVLGTVCRSGLAGWFFGNTAETVLQGIPCSAVVVKPAGLPSLVPPEPAS